MGRERGEGIQNDICPRAPETIASPLYANRILTYDCHIFSVFNLLLCNFVFFCFLQKFTYLLKSIEDGQHTAG